MLRVLLLRSETSDEGTFGSFVASSGGASLKLFSGELPWRSNTVKRSCIPQGDYLVTPYSSRKYPDHYLVNKVPGRSSILIHQGNWCGDVTKGLLSNVEGCILVGLSFGRAKNQKAVLNSLLAMDKLRKFVGKEPFELSVRNNYDS